MDKISHEAGNRDAWVCVCGNTPSGDGFFECDAEGREVEPVEGEWHGLYVCNGCGIVVDGDTLDVVGQGIPPHRLEQS